MNLPFIGSRIAPIQSPQHLEAESTSSKVTMRSSSSTKAEKIPTRSQLDISRETSGTPDSVTMYPAHAPYKALEHQAASAPTKSIPIVKNLKRTPSELQLMEDEAAADFRDYCMYTRIVSGITGARRHPADVKAINNIVRTRHLPVADNPSSYAEQNSRYTMVPDGMVPSLESACRITDDTDDLLFEDDPPSPAEEGVFVMDL